MFACRRAIQRHDYRLPSRLSNTRNPALIRPTVQSPLHQQRRHSSQQRQRADHGPTSRNLGDLDFFDERKRGEDEDGDEFLRKHETSIVLGVLLFTSIMVYFIAKSDESVVRMARTLHACYKVWKDYEHTLQQMDQEGVEEEGEKWQKTMHELHLRSAQRLLDVCLMNGGVFIKVGQTISSLNHLLPVEYTSTFECCQDRAPCQPYDEIESVFIDQFGGPPQRFFEEFDPKPLASASLAQVHRAKLRTGEDVVVKIQYNSIEERMMDDLKVLSWINSLYASFGRLNMPLGWLLEEFRTNLRAELDFEQEAKNNEKFALMFRGMPEVTCPKIHWNLTSRKVITMEYIDGIKITDVKSMHDQNFVDTDHIASLLAAVYGKQIFLDGIVHCDPHPGNIFIRRKSDRFNDVELVFLDHGLYREMEPEYRLNYNTLWKGLMFRDSDTVKQYTTRYSLLDNKAKDKKDKEKYEMAISDKSLEDLYRLFGSMCLSRRWLPEDVRIGMDPIVTKEEADWISRYARDNLLPLNLVLTNCPKDLLLLFKVNEHMRSINQTLGSGVNYFTVFTLFAQRGINVKQYVREQYKRRHSSTIFRALHMGLLAARQFFGMLLMMLRLHETHPMRQMLQLYRTSSVSLFEKMYLSDATLSADDKMY